MTIHFAEMIAKKQAITDIDDVILQANIIAEKWKKLESYFQCLRSSGLKATPNKTKLYLRIINFLDIHYLIKESNQSPRRSKTWKI